MKQLAAIISIAISFLLLTSCTTYTGAFTLLNAASERIIRASVEICGQRIDLNDIEPNESASGSYVVRGDDHYTIAVEFRSGTKLRTETGYVTSGFSYEDEITVTDTDIEITNTKAM